MRVAIGLCVVGSLFMLGCDILPDFPDIDIDTGSHDPCSLLDGGCSACGNSIVEGDEQCDGVNLSGADCAVLGYEGGTLACAADCTLDETGCTSTPDPICGDGNAEGAEECDGADLASKSCVTEGFTGGTLACASNCTLDTTSCITGPICGDGTAEGTEECDGADLASKSCLTEGFTGGALGCATNCTLDKTGCTTGQACGDGAIVAPEECDGSNMAGQSCLSRGYTGGTLACASNCTLDTTSCTTGPICGDGMAEGTEQCDVADLAGNTCLTAGYTGGTVACASNCTLDTSSCFTALNCGDGMAEGSEECDFSDLAGKSCLTEGFAGGTLACASNCTLDTTGCTTGPICGDGMAEAIEECDGADLYGMDCFDFGADGGTLACDIDCGYDLSGCTYATCGNNVIEALETCDGTQLGGASCVSLGFAGGVLACQHSCTLDVSGCTGTPACASLGSSMGDSVASGSNVGLFDATAPTSCGPDSGGVEACFDWTAPVTGLMQIDTMGSEYDTVLYVKDSVGTEVACNDDDVSLQSLLLLDVIAGETFTIVLDAFASGDYGDYVLNIITAPVCGDNVAESTEACDGTDHDGWDCTSYGYTGGTLVCSAACDGFYVTGCTDPICGDGMVAPVEECDGSDLSGYECASAGFDAGTLSCDPVSCTLDWSGCACDPATQWTCGDGACIPAEWLCDGIPDCASSEDEDPANCPVCGDGIAEGAEECDGADLNGYVCDDLGFGPGALSCDLGCTLDVSGCTCDPATQWTCGDGACIPAEWLCDSIPDCTSSEDEDPANCPVCGDGVAEGAEECDGGDMNGYVCENFGYSGGALSCDPSCYLDASGCSGGMDTDTHFDTDTVFADTDTDFETDTVVDDTDTDFETDTDTVFVDTDTSVSCPAGYVLVGPACEDIDECAMGLDDCSPMDTCVNTQGSFYCSGGVG